MIFEHNTYVDNQSAKMIQDAFNQVTKGRTTIIVAHRLTTIRNADLIFVFEKGNVVEQGTHTELIQIENGIYRALLAQSDQEKELTDAIEQQTPDDSSNDLIRAHILTQQMSSHSIQAISFKSDVTESEESIKKCFPTPLLIKLLQLNSPEKFYLILGSICALLYGGVEPAVGLVYSMIYSLFANPDLEAQSLRTRNFSLSIFGIYIFAGIVQFVSTTTFAKAGEELISRMRLFTFEGMLRREISWFDHEQNSVGALVTRLSSDTTAIKVNSFYCHRNEMFPIRI